MANIFNTNKQWFNLFKLKCNLSVKKSIYRLNSSHIKSEFDDLLKTIDATDLEELKKDKASTTKLSESYLRIIGNGNHGSPKSFLLVVNQKKYIFNCGEGISRILMEMGYTKLENFNNLFFTNSSWNECFSGTLNLINEILKHNEELTFHSPFKAVDFIEETFSDLLQLKTAKNRKLLQYDYASTNDFRSDNLSVKNIKLKDVSAYLISINNEVNKFLKILVVDFPNLGYLELFSKNPEFNTKNMSDLDFILHISPKNVVKSGKYMTFFENIGNKTKKNLYLDESENNLISKEIYKKQLILNKLNETIFPMIPLDLEKTSFIPNQKSKNVKTSMCFKLLNDLRSNSFFDRVKKWDNLKNRDFLTHFQLQKIKKAMPFSKSTITNKVAYPSILFLGTSSGNTTIDRNQSGILVNLDEKQSILMDCGVGILGQFIRFYGEENYMKELVKLKVAFISHIHLDHYQGIHMLIVQRVKAFKKLNKPYEKLILLHPTNLLPYLKSDGKYFGDYLDKSVDLVNNERLLDAFKNQSVFNGIDNLSYIQTSNVLHIDKSYGLVFETKNKIKIAYTGDCSPSRELIKKGYMCNILIHEATYSDQNVDQAEKTRHSTISQVNYSIVYVETYMFLICFSHLRLSTLPLK